MLVVCRLPVDCLAEKSLNVTLWPAISPELAPAATVTSVSRFVSRGAMCRCKLWMGAARDVHIVWRGLWSEAQREQPGRQLTQAAIACLKTLATPNLSRTSDSSRWWPNKRRAENNGRKNHPAKHPHGAYLPVSQSKARVRWLEKAIVTGQCWNC